MAATYCGSCMTNDAPEKSCSVAECVNSGNRVVSTAILCNSCMAKILSNPDAADIFLREVQQIVIDGHNFNQKKLADLNADVLMLIFDGLEVLDMMNLIDVYPARQLLAIANDSFWRRYKNYQVLNDQRFGPKGIEIYSGCISTSKLTETFLRLFGGGIKNLKIQYPSTIAIQYINKYARNSLTKLSISFLKENQFDYFNKPYNNIEELYFHNEFNAEIKAGNLTFCQLFPKLQKLSMLLNSDIETSVIDCEFPYLKHFDVYERNMKSKESIFTMITKNPQIQSIGMETLSQEFYNIINKYVQNLENLTVSNINTDGGACFEHVKHLKVHPYCDKIDKLSLPQLKSLEIGFIDKNPAPWAEFIKKHQYVSHLKVIGAKGYGIHYSLTELMNQLPNLVEITLFKSENAIRDETISNIIDSSKIEKIILITSYVSEKHLNRLRKKYENTWNIVENNSTDTLSFEKMN